MNSTTRLPSQNPSRVFMSLSESILIDILPAFLCFSTYSPRSFILSSQISPSEAKQVISPARQLSPFSTAICSWSVSICSLTKSLMLADSLRSYTPIALYFSTAQLKSFSSCFQKSRSIYLKISCLSSCIWLWMLSLSPRTQSKMRSLLRLSSSNITICWQHFCLVSWRASDRLVQVGLLFYRKCCSVCSTMQLGQRGMRHPLSQQKLVRSQLGWQAQKMRLVSEGAAAEVAVRLTREDITDIFIYNHQAYHRYTSCLHLKMEAQAQCYFVCNQALLRLT